MDSMTKEDVIAEVALRDLEKVERLRKIVHQSGLEYYTGGRFLGLASILPSAAFMVWLVLRENVPAWGVIIGVVALIGSVEGARQRDRFNALLELIELEKREANKATHTNPLPALSQELDENDET